MNYNFPLFFTIFAYFFATIFTLQVNEYDKEGKINISNKILNDTLLLDELDSKSSDVTLQEENNLTEIKGLDLSDKETSSVLETQETNNKVIDFNGNTQSVQYDTEKSDSEITDEDFDYTKELNNQKIDDYSLSQENYDKIQDISQKPNNSFDNNKLIQSNNNYETIDRENFEKTSSNTKSHDNDDGFLKAVSRLVNIRRRDINKQSNITDQFEKKDNSNNKSDSDDSDNDSIFNKLNIPEYVIWIIIYIVPIVFILLLCSTVYCCCRRR